MFECLIAAYRKEVTYVSFLKTSVRCEDQRKGELGFIQQVIGGGDSVDSRSHVRWVCIRLRILRDTSVRRQANLWRWSTEFMRIGQSTDEVSRYKSILVVKT